MSCSFIAILSIYQVLIICYPPFQALETVNKQRSKSELSGLMKLTLLLVEATEGFILKATSFLYIFSDNGKLHEGTVLDEHWPMPLVTLIISKMLFVICFLEKKNKTYRCVYKCFQYMVPQCILSVRHVDVMKTAISYFVIVNFAYIKFYMLSDFYCSLIYCLSQKATTHRDLSRVLFCRD